MKNANNRAAKYQCESDNRRRRIITNLAKPNEVSKESRKTLMVLFA
jgi:hypothetical protein